jgi:hypothetical protein
MLRRRVGDQPPLFNDNKNLNAPSPRASTSGASLLSLSTAPQSFRLVWLLVSSTIVLAFGLWWVHVLDIVYERKGAGWGRMHLLFGCLITYQAS